MLLGGRDVLMAGGGFPPVRFIRCIVVTTRGLQQDNKRITQWCKMEFLNAAGEVFRYPSNTTYTMSTVFRNSSSESPLQALRYSTNYKFCVEISQGSPNANLPVVITYDLGSASLDVSVYSKWRIYTANDTGTHPDRNPSLQLWASSDGVDYKKLDEVDYSSFPSASRALAFTRRLKI